MSLSADAHLTWGKRLSEALPYFLNICRNFSIQKALSPKRESLGVLPLVKVSQFPEGKAVRLAAMNFLEDAWVTRDGIYYLERRADMPLAPAGEPRPSKPLQSILPG